jgi:hypothetical protein
MRDGDNPGHPSIDCYETKKYPFLTASRIPLGKARSKPAVHCSSTKDASNGILSWENFFFHLNSCDGGIPMCIQEYDAVFFATNGPYSYPNRLAFYALLNKTKIFYLDDFPFVKKELKRAGLGVIDSKPDGYVHPVALFLVEMSILMHTAYFQSSVPSSISDIIYHYRQDSRLDRDVLPYMNWYRMYNEFLLLKSAKPACAEPCF